MEAVATDALARQRTRQGEARRDGRHGVVESGVEAGHLWEAGTKVRYNPHRRQAVGLVQRRERRQGVQRPKDSFIQQDRARVFTSAVNDPVADRPQRVGVETGVDPCEQVDQYGPVVRPVGPTLSADLGTVGLPRGQARRAVQAFDLALGDERQTAVVGGFVQGELDARRAGVESEHRTGH